MLIRIFISSPGDVVEEREKARVVIEGLQRWYAESLTLQTVLWEDLPLQADASFQQGIDAVLAQSHGIDIAVFIVWARLGSTLGGDIRRPDGTPYRSGTEREFDLMLAARQQTGGARPHVLAYVRDDTTGFVDCMRCCRDTTQMAELIRQRDLAEQFIAEHFKDAAGANIRAYHTFPSPVAFAERLRVHLRALLDEYRDQVTPAPTRWTEAPYRGLEVFDVSHACIFCGREEEIAEVTQRLREREEVDHCAFVVLVGASGSGKSSLARAGVAASLLQGNLETSIRQWRCAILSPSAGSHCSVFEGLAQALAAEGAVPELRGQVARLEDLANALSATPDRAVSLALEPALKLGAQAVGGPLRLLLVIDQLEELYSDRRILAGDRDRFLAAIEVLARSGHVRVLATLRSDFYPLAQREAVFLRLKGDRGHVDLLPPRGAALRRIISEPARLVGLHFEGDAAAGRALEVRILEDAMDHPDALPLLEYTLRELYEQRTAAGCVTIAAYEAMGGVEGALNRRIEAVFTALPGKVQGALDDALWSLITIDPDNETMALRRRVPLSMPADDSPRRALFEALIGERFLTADRAGDRPTVTLAHEALLRSWPRITEWLEENRDLLRIRRRVEEAARVWDRKNRHPDYLLAPGLPLAEAETLLSRRPHELNRAEGELTRAFIERSIQSFRETGRRRIRRLYALTSLFALLTLMAASGGWIAWQKKNDAERARRSLEMTTELADRNLYAFHMEAIDHAWRNGSQGLIRDLLQVHRGTNGAPQAFPFEWHFWNHRCNSELKPSITADAAVSSLAFSPHGDRLALGLADGRITLLDAADGRIAVTLRGLAGPASGLCYSADGERFAALGPQGRLTVWNPVRGATICSFPVNGDLVGFFPDGRRLACAADNDVRVYEVDTGREALVYTGVPRSSTYVNAVGYVNNERGGTSVVGNGAGMAPGFAGAISADGRKLAAAQSDCSIRIWTTDESKQPLDLPPPGHCPVFINSLAFSPDGRWLVSGGLGGLRVWDADSGAIRSLKSLSFVFRVAFSRSGLQVLTASENHVSVWEWHGEELELLSSVRLPGRDPANIGFSPDARALALVSDVQDVSIWRDYDTGGVTPLWRSVCDGCLVKVPAYALSPDGNQMAILEADGACQVSDLRTGKPLVRFTTHPGRTNAPLALHFSTDGSQLATLADHGLCEVWETRTGTRLAAFETAGNPQARAAGYPKVLLSPDSTRLVTVGSSGHLDLWNTASGTQVMTCTLQPVDYRKFVVAFSPDARLLAVLDPGGFHLWNAGSGTVAGVFRDQAERVLDFAFSPDGRRLVLRDKDSTLRAWDVVSGRALFAFECQGEAQVDLRSRDAFSLAFSRDGQRLASTSGLVWEAHTGRQISSFKPVGRVFFSPDGRRLAVDGYDGHPALLDVGSGHKVLSLLAPPVGFSDDGERLLCATEHESSFNAVGIYLYWGTRRTPERRP